jgi:hypothetical protein
LFLSGSPHTSKGALDASKDNESKVSGRVQASADTAPVSDDSEYEIDTTKVSAATDNDKEPRSGSLDAPPSQQIHASTGQSTKPHTHESSVKESDTSRIHTLGEVEKIAADEEELFFDTLPFMSSLPDELRHIFNHSPASYQETSDDDELAFLPVQPSSASEPHAISLASLTTSGANDSEMKARGSSVSISSTSQQSLDASVQEILQARANTSSNSLVATSQSIKESQKPSASTSLSSSSISFPTSLTATTASENSSHQPQAETPAAQKEIEKPSKLSELTQKIWKERAKLLNFPALAPIPPLLSAKVSNIRNIASEKERTAARSTKRSLTIIRLMLGAAIELKDVLILEAAMRYILRRLAERATRMPVEPAIKMLVEHIEETLADFGAVHTQELDRRISTAKQLLVVKFDWFLSFCSRCFEYESLESDGESSSTPLSEPFAAFHLGSASIIPNSDRSTADTSSATTIDPSLADPTVSSSGNITVPHTSKVDPHIDVLMQQHQEKDEQSKDGNVSKLCFRMHALRYGRRL